LAPTKELVSQIFVEANKIGKYHDLSISVLTGGKSYSEEMHILEYSNFVIATPGRLIYHLENSVTFDYNNLKMFIMDEVDMILELGFYNDLIRILDNINKIKKQTLFFSATLNENKINNLIKLSTNDNKTEIIELSYQNKKVITPKLLTQNYIFIEYEDKFNYFYSFICSHLKNKIIVFFATIKAVRFF